MKPPTRSILQRATTVGRTTLALVAFAAACSGSSNAKTDGGTPAPGGSWRVVLQNLDAALMSVDGTSATDVWAVGADTRDGNGAMVLHFDGTSWRRKATGVNADLWWVHAFSADALLMGGTQGTILRYDGQQFTRMDTPGTGQVFGVWGASENDVWAVGGEPDAEPGFVWRYDGSAWSDVSDMLPASVKGTPLFKVWGRTENDVWIVGLDGVAVHWNGTELELGDTGTKDRLFTVHGPPSGKPAFVAVGGDASAVLVQNDDGTKWHTPAHNPAPTQLFGVFMRSTKEGYAVGYDGIVLRYDGAAWKLLTTPFELTNPLHSVWVDPSGGVWAVGGDVLSPVPSDGVLVHQGKAIPHEITAE
jgi:hypothetical protein